MGDDGGEMHCKGLNRELIAILGNPGCRIGGGEVHIPRELTPKELTLLSSRGFPLLKERQTDGKWVYVPPVRRISNKASSPVNQRLRRPYAPQVAIAR